jgi:trehalose synthase-fused probable maltokinase
MASSGRRSRTAPRARRGADAALAQAAVTLPAWLPAQRWFGAKSRTIERVVPLDHASVPPTGGLLALFRVEFAEGPPEVYCVPLRAGAGQWADALDDPAFCTRLVEAMRERAQLPGRHGAFTCAPESALGELLPEPARDALRVTGEQSNTSVIVGGRAILKLLRRLEPGPSPELELTAFLTGEAGFRGAPRLAGSVAYALAGEAPVTIAMLHEFVPNQGDAWTAIQGHLDEYYAAVGHGGARAPAPAIVETLAAADTEDARSLGALTGRLHMALASAPGGSPLAAERIEGAHVVAWLEGMYLQLDRALGALGGIADSLQGDARRLAGRVLAERERLRDGLGELRALEAAEVTRIRVHGDYHLGQVLRTPDGFVILDFEGEPARPLVERRAKQCALKDVAGMLRSYAYAAQAALLRAVEARPDDRGLADRLAPWEETWETGMRHAFLQGYLAETAERGATFLPARRDDLERVLRAFELDKAVYELAYEIDHRPDWTRVPLLGLARTLATRPAAQAVAPRPDEGPFRFVGCIELHELVGERAEDERRLAELIDRVPVDSIHFHTHAFLLRHRFVAGIYPNDFATWVAVHARDQVLGESLAMVDPADFTDLEALRQELVAVIDGQLRRLPAVPRGGPDEPFDFVRARLVPVPLGVEVTTLAELRQALLEIDVSAVYYHLVEARRRLGGGDNDLARWLERGLGLTELAGRVRALNPYTASLERTRARLIQLCDVALAEAARP